MPSGLRSKPGPLDPDLYFIAVNGVKKFRVHAKSESLNAYPKKVTLNGKS
jgi:hypothetical protein